MSAPTSMPGREGVVSEEPSLPLDPTTGWALRPTTPAEQVWWVRVNRKAGTQPSGLLPEILSDFARDVLRVIGATWEIVDGHRREKAPEQLTVEYKVAEIQRLSDDLGRRLGVGPRPAVGALPLRVNLRQLTDDELTELEEIVGRIEDGEV